MALFGRKEDKEMDPEEELELLKKQRREEKKLERKFKDLNPTNKKKRKEPPKPWGKKERYIVLALFIATAWMAASMAFRVREYKLPGIPRISLENIELGSIFKSETITIGKKTGGQTDETARAVVSFFNKEVDGLSGKYGMLVVRLGDGYKYGVNINEPFQGASLLKLPLMLFLYKQKDAGKLNLDTKYTLKNTDKIEGSGLLKDAPEGSVFTYRRLIELMGKNSDRTAYNVMKKIAGEEGYREYVREIGMGATNINSGETTPEDLGLLFSRMWRGELISQKSIDELTSYLTDTIYEKHIPAGIPDEVKIAHKFGADAGILNDAGIVYTDNPYVLVFMGDGIITKDADVFYPKISKYIYEAENDMK